MRPFFLLLSLAIFIAPASAEQTRMDGVFKFSQKLELHERHAAEMYGFAAAWNSLCEGMNVRAVPTSYLESLKRGRNAQPKLFDASAERGQARVHHWWAKNSPEARLAQCRRIGAK